MSFPDLGWQFLLYFPDVVDSRFPEQVDNLLESLTSLLKRNHILPIATIAWNKCPNYLKRTRSCSATLKNRSPDYEKLAAQVMRIEIMLRTNEFIVHSSFFIVHSSLASPNLLATRHSSSKKKPSLCQKARALIMFARINLPSVFQLLVRDLFFLNLDFLVLYFVVELIAHLDFAGFFCHLIN